jgi:spore coat protein U-like protein
MRRLAPIAALACSAALGQSAPTSGTLEVRATIESGCRVSGQDEQISDVDFGTLAFGAWPSLFTTTLTAQAQGPAGTIEIRCNGVSSAAVTIGAGLNPDGAQRQLASGADRVPYDLYADAAFSEPFAAASQRTLPMSADGGIATASLPIYGKVEPGIGGYPPGLYSDVVQITVSW